MYFYFRKNSMFKGRLLRKKGSWGMNSENSVSPLIVIMA